MSSKNIRLLKTLRAYGFDILYTDDVYKTHVSNFYIHIQKRKKTIKSVYGIQACDLCIQISNFQTQLISENNNIYICRGHVLLLLCYLKKVFTVCIENDSLEDF